jgi:hypothetical protein
MIARLARFLRSPHPANTSYATGLKVSLSITLFVVAFLTAFQPFGLNTLQGPRKMLIIAGYGLPCLCGILLAMTLTTVWARIGNNSERWQVWHEISRGVAMIVLIGAANYLYSALCYGLGFDWRDLGSMVVYTLLVSIFPTTGMVIWANQRMAKRNIDAATELNASVGQATATSPLPTTQAQTAPVTAKATTTSAITLIGENRDETLTAAVDEICFIKAEGNYVELTLAKAGEKPRTVLLRASMKDAEEQLAGHADSLARCHRSYMVNRTRIAHAEGNALGLVLTLDRAALSVPVSRSYVADFRGGRAHCC